MLIRVIGQKSLPNSSSVASERLYRCHARLTPGLICIALSRNRLARRRSQHTFMLFKLAPCGRTVLVDLVPDSPPIRTGHDGQRICDERLGLTSAVLPAWAVSWALTTPRPLCLLAGYLVAGHNVPA